MPKNSRNDNDSPKNNKRRKTQAVPAQQENPLHRTTAFTEASSMMSFADINAKIDNLQKKQEELERSQWRWRLTVQSQQRDSELKILKQTVEKLTEVNERQQTFLNTAKKLVNIPYPDSGKTLLHSAVADNNSILSLALLMIGADVNAKAGSHTPLSTAIKKGNEQIITQLMQSGANLQQAKRGLDLQRNKYNDFHRVSERGHTKAVKIFVEMLKCDVNIRDDKGRSPLFYALINGHKETVDLLESKGAKIQDAVTSVYLHIKSLGEQRRLDFMLNYDRVKFLHQYGIVINTWGSFRLRELIKISVRYPSGLNPRQRALFKKTLDRYFQVCKLSQSKFNSLGKDGYSPLSYTIHFGSRKLMSDFIKHGADLQNIDGKGTSALKYATDQLKGQRRLDMLVLLAKKGARFNFDEEGSVWKFKKLLKAKKYQKTSEIVQLFKSPVPVVKKEQNSTDVKSEVTTEDNARTLNLSL
jgi:ankyrin repeat protein